MNQFGIALFWCGVQVTLLSLAVTVACAVMRRSNPALRSWTVLLTLLAIPCLTLLLLCPVPSWFDAGAAAAIDEIASVEQDVSDAKTIQPATETHSEVAPAPTKADGGSSLANFAAAFADEIRSTSAAVETTPQIGWPTWLAWIVVASSALGLLHLTIGWLATQAYRTRATEVHDRDLHERLDVTRAKLNCRRKIQLLQTTRVSSAATFGFFRPVILLPEDWRTWTHEERQAVLAHEVAHVVHRDYATGLAAQLCLAMHFYHPLVHWLVARLRLDQELSADAAAAAISGGHRDYLTTLAEMALRQDDRVALFPARMFLPTRQSFLRRVEMLRTWKVLPVRSSKRSRSVALVALLSAIVVVAGLRSPLQTTPVVAQEPASDAALSELAPTFDTRFVSEDGGSLFAVRPARLIHHEGLQVFRKIFDELAQESRGHERGFLFADIDQVIGTSKVGFEAPELSSLYIKGTKKIDYSVLIEDFAGSQLKEMETQYGQATYYLVPGERAVEPKAYWLPDDRTLVYDTVRHIRRYINGDEPTQRLLKSETWEQINEADAIFLADQEGLEMMLQEVAEDESNPLVGLLLKPLLGKTRLLAASVEVGSDVQVRAMGRARDAEEATEVAESLDAARVLAKNMLQQMARQANEAPPNTPQARFANDPLTRAGIKLTSKELAEIKIGRREKITEVTGALTFKELQTVLGPAAIAARTAAQRAASMNNLKQIALAFHNYHATYNHFPGAAATPEGKRHPVSWRVAILPFIEQKQLYDQYNFDEPWDSTSNRKLIAKMPAVYRHPNERANVTSPSYFVLTGPDTIFRNAAPKIREVLDGTSNTILAVEAKRDIPWTKPEDISFDKSKPIPPFGGYSQNGYNTAFADGAVRFISEDVDQATLQLLIMSQDGTPVDFQR